VIHYVGTGWELLGFPALKEARRLGSVFTVWPAVHPGSWGDGPLDIHLYQQADAIFAQSQFEKKHLTALGVPGARVHVTGLAPAVEVQGCGARFRVKHGLRGRPLILFLGRRQKYKGFHELCRAMPIVLKMHPDTCLVSIGPWGEPPYPPVPAQAQLDLEKADEIEKADALAACDVLCVPSSGEAFGMVYVEAWSYGKPVVAGPAPAVRELVSDAVNGFCVDQRADEIAGALIRLLSDPALRMYLGSNGQRLQEQQFTWAAVAEVHKRVFEQALQRPLRR
jgi:glycosyltransferase involved in cell wall biosynthesis